MNCSFTGHRNIEPENLGIVKDRLKRAVEYAYNEGCRNFLCGGALGFDTLAAREVILFRLTHSDARLVMVLPCREQSTNWSERQRDSYDYILSNADEVIYTGDDYTPSCMRKRNMYLACNCDILICYLSKSASGAGQTVRMATKLYKKVYNLYPTRAKM